MSKQKCPHPLFEHLCDTCPKCGIQINDYILQLERELEQFQVTKELLRKRTLQLHRIEETALNEDKCQNFCSTCKKEMYYCGKSQAWGCDHCEEKALENTKIE